MTTISGARKALQNLHREYLHAAMHIGDREYARATNAIFDLLNRIEDEGIKESD